jgi:hypothetical protein
MICDECGGNQIDGCSPVGPYCGFRIASRMYAGKIVASGTHGYAIKTPGRATHRVLKYRVVCIPPMIFNTLLKNQLRNKRFRINDFNWQYTTYMDHGVFEG